MSDHETTRPSARCSLSRCPCAALAQDVPPHVDALLKQIKAADKEQLAVSEEDGRFLRLLVVTRGAKRALEIGAASGYSAIWMGLGMRETGGKLVTIEYDKARAARRQPTSRRPVSQTSCR